MKNLNVVSVEEVKRGDDVLSLIFSNIKIKIEKDEVTPAYPWFPRNKNVRKGEWTYHEEVVAPEDFCVTIHEIDGGGAITIVINGGGPKCTKIQGFSEDETPIFEIFQYYSSCSGRTVGIGVNIAPGWKDVSGNNQTMPQDACFIKQYRDGRVILNDTLQKGNLKEKTVKTLSGKLLTYLVSDLLEIRSRGADVLVVDPLSIKTVMGHRASHDIPDAMWQIQLTKKNNANFNLALFEGEWYHCSAEMWTPSEYERMFAGVAFLRKLKIQPVGSKSKSQHIKYIPSCIYVDGMYAYSSKTNNTKEVVWKDIHPEEDVLFMERYLAEHGVKGVLKSARKAINSQMFIVTSRCGSFLVSSKKYERRYEVYHVGSQAYADIDISAFTKRLNYKFKHVTLLDALKKTHADFVVRLEDSMSAGNCESGTVRFAKEIWGNGITKDSIITKVMIESKIKEIETHQDRHLFINVLNNMLSSEFTAIISAANIRTNTELALASISLPESNHWLDVHVTSGEWVYHLYADSLRKRLCECIQKDEHGTMEFRLSHYHKQMTFMGAGIGGGLQDSSFYKYVTVRVSIPMINPEVKDKICEYIGYGRLFKITE